MNFMRRLGISLSTLQKIEAGRLAVSMKVAYAMARQTGIGHRYFLENRLPPQLNIERVCERYKRDGLQPELNATAGNHLYRLEYLRPRAKLFGYFTLLLDVAGQLQNSGCESSGFYRKLEKAVERLLNCIGDTRIRRDVYEKSKAVVSGGTEAVLRVVQAEIKELRRAIKSKGKQ
jgi:transcriptional regulator with XRE-family HTH domain